MLQKAHWSFQKAFQLYVNMEFQNYFTVVYTTTFHLSLTVLFHYRSLTFYLSEGGSSSNILINHKNILKLKYNKFDVLLMNVA